jgi:hypothetical protein
MSGHVDVYLDEIFDRLAGTGSTGRRALAETEDHLRAAVEDGVASGLSPEQAEHEAVTRFGPAAKVARQLGAVHRRRTALAALSGGWLVAGLAVLGLGVTYLGAAVNAAAGGGSTQGGKLFTTIAELQYVNFKAQFDDVPVSQPRDTALVGLFVLLAGAAILAGRAFTGRRTGLPPTSRRFPALAAAVFLLVCAVFVGRPPSDQLFSVWQGPGLRIATIGAAVALVTAAGMATWGLARARR